MRQERECIEARSHDGLLHQFPRTSVRREYSPGGDFFDASDYAEEVTVYDNQEYLTSYEDALNFCRQYYDAAIRFLEEVIAELVATQGEQI